MTFIFTTSIEELGTTLKAAHIPTKGLFINADAGFDAAFFRKWCDQQGIRINMPNNKRRGKKRENNYLDEVLYKGRFVIERTNAWMDSFRSVLHRFATTLSSWIGWNILAFIVLGIKKGSSLQLDMVRR